MPLTREFKETLTLRVNADPASCAALLSEAVELLMSGDKETGKLVLRHYIEAAFANDETQSSTSSAG